MARARNIKPSFFQNEHLAEISPLGRLLFIGLWTLADYRGCMEWRPKRVKAQLFPYENCDVEKLAIKLDNSGFIRFYSEAQKLYIKIVNFEKHQNPHKNERDRPVEFGDYCETKRQAVDIKGLTINRDKSGGLCEDSASTPADSLNLIPDSLNLIPSNTVRFKAPTLSEAVEYFTSKDSTAEQAERFINFYESKGWIVGKTKMQKWKAAASNWINRNQSPAYPAKSGSAAQQENNLRVIQNWRPDDAV